MRQTRDLISNSKRHCALLGSLLLPQRYGLVGEGQGSLVGSVVGGGVWSLASWCVYGIQPHSEGVLLQPLSLQLGPVAAPAVRRPTPCGLLMPP